MNFNERLIELRRSKALSQDELGEKLGVSRQTISKWELGQSYPDFKSLVSISDYFKLTLDELVKGVNVQDVRDNNSQGEQISSIYSDVSKVKKISMILLNTFAIIGAAMLLITVILMLVGYTSFAG